MLDFRIRRAVLAGIAIAASFALPLPAQSAPGFASSTLWVERAQPFSVRGFAYDAAQGDFLVAVGGTLFRQDQQGTRTTLHAFAAPEEVAALTHRPGDALVRFTALNAGTLHTLDLATGAIGSAPGVANTFDLTVLPGGEVLASANPQWPAPGAATGVWHLAPGGRPRELIRLRGASGPLHALPDGSLLVADLGAVIPAPPGAVRVLRFTGAQLAQVLQGGASLTHSNGVPVLLGLDGAYDLASDAAGRIYVSQPQSPVLLRTLPGGGLDPVPLAALPGTGALQLELAPRPAPMLPWQPREHATALLVASSDFASEYRLLSVHPERPELVLPASPAGPGPVALRLRDAPAGGLAFLAFSFAQLQRERVAITLQGTPVWLALSGDPLAPTLTTLLPIDAQGAGLLSLQHPGGFGFDLALQALTIGPAGPPALGTTAAHMLRLLP